MAKFKFTKQKVRLLITIGGGLLFVVIIGIVLCTSGAKQDVSKKINEKILIAAQTNGMSVEDVKKDKFLMSQIKMEVEQEKKIDELTANITVTDEEIKHYRDMIGSTMDIKKSLVVLFNSYDECKAFVEEYGNKNNVTKLNMGVLPLMENDEDGQQYYNVVGNEVLETAFDNLADGEYSKVPIEFSGVYCYLKRLSVSSPTQNDQEIKELIKSEKAHEKLNEGR